MMPNDLFVRLSKYAPRAGKSAIENFFTELVGHLLAQEDAALQEFLGFLPSNLADGLRDAKVTTQYSTESRNIELARLRPDLVLRSSAAELIVENKVDDKLEEKQLRQYLDYAQERRHAYVVVASRAHNSTVEKFEHNPQFPRFEGEILWWQVADRWSKRRTDFSDKYLIEGVLEFMEENQMGAFEPFQQEEMSAPSLWREFVKKRDQILSRLSMKIGQATSLEACGLQPWGEYPSRETVGALIRKGLVWCSPRDADPANSDFWYSLGFIYGRAQWLLPPLDEGQPECVAFVGAWQPERVRDLMLEEAKRLSTSISAPAFRVDYSDKQGAVFLFRRRQLKDFMKESDQAAAILEFLEQSHKQLELVVPKIHQHYRQGA
jgi:hypothetical protein